MLEMLELYEKTMASDKADVEVEDLPAVEDSSHSSHIKSQSLLCGIAREQGQFVEGRLMEQDEQWVVVRLMWPQVWWSMELVHIVSAGRGMKEGGSVYLVRWRCLCGGRRICWRR